ncbi:VanW family protein [Nocardioides bruguierae]|uniref:VanW family protein n=1 Tax=Nocardioides bruguierae TaxID=2945102 RepID=UPI0020215A34|nr:VanW family protein [Nocardioides bruguierae]MCL8025716.1 VanW family protein [Nocardioides bruguierae]
MTSPDDRPDDRPDDVQPTDVEPTDPERDASQPAVEPEPAAATDAEPDAEPDADPETEVLDTAEPDPEPEPEPEPEPADDTGFFGSVATEDAPPAAAAAAAGTPAKAPKPARSGPGGKVALLTVLALVVLVGGGYAAAALAAGDRLPQDATVAGVEVGGLIPSAAETRLEEALSETASAPIDVVVDGTTTTLTPGELGLSIDYAASVAAAGGGRSFDPRRVWDWYTGGDETDAVVAVDEDALAATVERLAADVAVAPVDGGVEIRRGRAVAVAAQDGSGLDVEDAAAALVAVYPGGDEVTLDPVDVEPAVSDADVADAIAGFGATATSGPVVLRFGGNPVRLTTRQFDDALRMTVEDGALVPSVRRKPLLALVDGATAGADAPVDATFRLTSDGEPRVVPAKPGVTYRPAAVTSAFLTAVSSDEDRTARVRAKVAEPELTTKEARALGVVEEVSSFTTEWPHADYRNTNIGRAAELVDGTLLLPGETFSMNDIVGERTRENGFTEGFIISNGILVEDLGGGVSQMATTLFNAMFFAGLEDVEHKPHSFYISRYPIGREATVVWGALDLRFRNNTDHGVWVRSSTTPSTPSSSGSVTVTMYSTKTWDITTSTSERYDYTAPTTRTLTTDDCYAYTGSQGFSIDVYRYFREPGQDELVDTETFHTVYTPQDSVVCEAPPSDNGGNGGGGNGGGGGNN